MKFNKNDLQESKAFKILQKYWLYIVVATAMIVVAISSISIYREEVLEIDPDVNHVQQDTLYFAATSIDTLNPVVSSSEDTFYISKLIYNSLFDYTDDLNVQPELAESYEVNTDRAYVDITLKDGVLWHDGTELTAGDVYSYDRDKAIELMAEQGYEDSDLNGKLENGDGEEVSLNILVNSDNANRLAAARIIEDNLESAGFSVTITSADWEEYTDLIERGEFDILVTGYEIEASYDLRGFFDGTNLWNYTNNDILQLVNELDRLHTSQEYTAAYEKIKEALIDEIPYYSLCYRKMGLVGLSTFEADQLPMFNDIYRNCNTWSWSIQEG